jgi:hypothetical protein
MEKENSITCECGGIYLKKNARRHEKSIKHQYYLLKQRETSAINTHYKEWEIDEPLTYEYNPLQIEKNIEQ